jgi:D-alanyl-lipoteichoic acid acyltransferase DltB (MBOAT superfamily)
MIICVYTFVVLTAALPLIFRRIYWLRVLCVLFLGFQAFLHLIFLDSEAHSIKDRALDQNGGHLPTDFQSALLIVRGLNQQEEILTALIFMAFVVLALFPCLRSKHKNDDRHDA